MEDADITITHYDEFEKLIMIIKELIDYYKRTTNMRNKVYKIYFNSQISLKIIQIMSLMFNQKKLQRVQTTMNRIYDCNVYLTLH